MTCFRTLHNHTRYADLEKRWWSQTSTATSDSKGSINCSNATDSTGYYTYRKSGKHDGKCLGMDFTLAKKDYDGHGSCRTKDGICDQYRLVPCVRLFSLPFTIICLGVALKLLKPCPRAMMFLRDAIFTLASGLHHVLEEEKNASVHCVYLRETMQKRGLPNGITGKITFQRGTSDRNFSHYMVSNFQGEQFVRLGSISLANGSFTSCGSKRGTPVFRGLCEPSTSIRTCDCTNVRCFCCCV